jgi:ribosomal protein S8
MEKPKERFALQGERISFRDLIYLMNVNAKFAVRAVQYATSLLAQSDAILLANTEKVRHGPGHRVVYSSEVIEHLREEFEKKGFFDREKAGRKKRTTNQTSENREPINYRVTISDLIYHMHLPSRHMRDAVSHIGKMIAGGDPQLKPHSLAAGKGYRITPSAEVKQYILHELTEKGFFKGGGLGKKAKREEEICLDRTLEGKTTDPYVRA